MIRIVIMLTWLVAGIAYVDTVSGQEDNVHKNPMVRMAAVPISPEKLDQVRALVHDLATADNKGFGERAHALGCTKFQIGLQTEPGINYLALRAECDSPNLERLLGPRLSVTVRLPPPDTLETLFDWDDDTVGPSARGKREGMVRVSRLTEENTRALRELTGELRTTPAYWQGLVTRARVVSYYKESMHLQRTDDGMLYLLYLERSGEPGQYTIQTYPPTEFTKWWSPRYAIARGADFDRQDRHGEVLFNWEGR